MVPWVVINRQHLPRAARGPRQDRKPCPIRVSRLSNSQSSASNLIFLNVSKFGRLDFQICQNSPFGTHPPPYRRKNRPFLFMHLRNAHFASLLFSNSCMEWGVPRSHQKKGRPHEHTNL